MATEFSFPDSMESAKNLLTDLCKKHGLGIHFDDEFGNFGSKWNSCALASDYVECSRFNSWNYDLLVFAVLHEIGHHEESANQTDMNIFCREYACWMYAIDRYIGLFGQNISVKQAKFMLDNLNSYVPNYNQNRNNDYNTSEDSIIERESTFYCPLKKEVIK